MRNKKAEMDGLGIILMTFVAIVVAVALYQGTFQNLGDSTGANLGSLVNASVTSPAKNGTVDMTGQELVGTPLVVILNDTIKNYTITITSGNYTITEGVNSQGVKGIIYTTSGNSEYAEKSLAVTYQYYPTGYVDDSGARSIVALIAIFAALAIGVVALIPTLRSGVLDLMGR